MKFRTLNIIFLFMMLCYGNFIAQNYIDVTASNSNKEKTSNQLLPQDNPMLNWEKQWTQESVKAINELIEEYGYPAENSSNRMYWIIPGDIPRTITYTENFLFNLPFEIDFCTNDDRTLISKNHPH